VEPRLTFEQVEPHLHKWANYFSRHTENQFEPWELINSAWAYGAVRLLPQSKIKFASGRILWDMLDYIRVETASRRQQRWDRKSKHWPKSFHFSALDDTEQRGKAFIETYPASSEDLEEKDLVSFLVNHPSLSRMERLIMKLTYVEGYTCKEAGQVCGYSESWIWGRRENVLKRLRAMVLPKII